MALAGAVLPAGADLRGPAVPVAALRPKKDAILFCPVDAPLLDTMSPECDSATRYCSNVQHTVQHAGAGSSNYSRLLLDISKTCVGFSTRSDAIGPMTLAVYQRAGLLRRLE